MFVRECKSQPPHCSRLPAQLSWERLCCNHWHPNREKRLQNKITAKIPSCDLQEGLLQLLNTFFYCAKLVLFAEEALAGGYLPGSCLEIKSHKICFKFTHFVSPPRKFGAGLGADKPALKLLCISLTTIMLCYFCFHGFFLFTKYLNFCV